MKPKSAKAKQPKFSEKSFSEAWRKARRASEKRLAKEHADRLKAIKAHQQKLDAELRKRKPVKRDLAQINFQAQHWWIEDLKARDRTIDEEKAALIYEAMRRRPEVQQAWLQGRDRHGVILRGFQPFVGFVITHLRKSWIELEPVTRQALIEEMQSWSFVPPLGYSTFPDKTSGREKQREASFHELRLPPPDDPASAQQFVKQARRFVDAGFVIVAVDKKKNERVRYAFEAIQHLPQTYRKQDLVEIAIGHLPADLPQAERDALEKKKQDGTLTIHDFTEAWSKHGQRKLWKEAKQLPAAESDDDWQPLLSNLTKVMGKRSARRTLIEEKIFNAAQIYHDLERIDLGLVPRGDFLKRLRLADGYL